jgi:hypothetical protein
MVSINIDSKPSSYLNQVVVDEPGECLSEDKEERLINTLCWMELLNVTKTANLP